MSKFITELCLKDTGNESQWELTAELIYQSDLLKATVVVPVGFITDLASVPRIPLVFDMWGDRSHYEAVIHDYLYCVDSTPVVTEDDANSVFKEAMKVRGKPWYIVNPMYWGVCLGGSPHYHKKHVADR